MRWKANLVNLWLTVPSDRSAPSPVPWLIPGFGSLAARAEVGVSLPCPLLPLGTELSPSLDLLSHRSSKACVVLAMLLDMSGLLLLVCPFLCRLHNREVVTSLLQCCLSMLLINSTTCRSSKGPLRCQGWSWPRYLLAVPDGRW